MKTIALTIFMINSSNNEPIIEELLSYGKILGLFDHFHEGEWEPNRISVNFEKNTGEKTIDYVYSLGHRRIAIIDGNMNRFSSVQRHEGYLRGLQKHNLEIRNNWIRYSGITTEKGYAAACELLDSCDGDYPTVICANNDSVAFGVYQAIEERGLCVPDDISVIGIDGHEKGMYTCPPLTTFTFDYEKMFSSLVSRTIDTIEEKADIAPTEFISSELIERSSCRRID